MYFNLKELLRKFECIEKLHDLIKREWEEWKKENKLEENFRNLSSNEGDNEIQKDICSANRSNNAMHKAREQMIEQAFIALSNLAMNEYKLVSLNVISHLIFRIYNFRYKYFVLMYLK